MKTHLSGLLLCVLALNVPAETVWSISSSPSQPSQQAHQPNRPYPTDRVRRPVRIRAHLITIKGHRIIRITHSMCTQAKLWWCNSRLSLWR